MLSSQRLDIDHGDSPGLDGFAHLKLISDLLE